MSSESLDGAAVRHVAGFGLTNGEDAYEVPSSVWPQLIGAVKTERLSGLATAAVGADALVVSEDQRNQLRTIHVEAMTWAVALERALLGVAAAAKEDDVEFVVLKGPSLAHCFYPDPSWRAFSDIDLLVRTRDWRRACALLDRVGFRREHPEPRAGFDERFGKAAVHASPQGLNVDLHRTLVLGSFGLWIEPEELFERTVEFELAGVTLRRLDDTALLLHACMHASLGFMEPLLLPVRDVAQVVRAGAVDWDAFAALAERWRLKVVVQHAFSLVERLLDVEPPRELSAMLMAPVRRKERKALEAYVTGRRARGGTVRATFWAVPGVRAKIGMLRALMFPDREFLADRSGGLRPSYIRRWLIPVRWLLRKAR